MRVKPALRHEFQCAQNLNDFNAAIKKIAARGPVSGSRDGVLPDMHIPVPGGLLNVGERLLHAYVSVSSSSTRESSTSIRSLLIFRSSDSRISIRSCCQVRDSPASGTLPT